MCGWRCGCHGAAQVMCVQPACLCMPPCHCGSNPVLPLRRLSLAAALWALSRVAVFHNLGTWRDCPPPTPPPPTPVRPAGAQRQRQLHQVLLQVPQCAHDQEGHVLLHAARCARFEALCAPVAVAGACVLPARHSNAAHASRRTKFPACCRRCLLAAPPRSLVSACSSTLPPHVALPQA